MAPLDTPGYTPAPTWHASVYRTAEYSCRTLAVGLTIFKTRFCSRGQMHAWRLLWGTRPNSVKPCKTV